MGILLLGAVIVALIVAVLVLQVRWDLDSPWDALRQLVMSTVPVPPMNRDSLRRRVLRWSGSLPMVMPSGARTLPGVAVARMSTQTALKLVPDGDVELLAYDLGLVLLTGAREQKVAIPPDAVLYVVLDDRLQTGWVTASLRHPDQTATAWVDLSTVDAPEATAATHTPVHRPGPRPDPAQETPTRAEVPQEPKMVSPVAPTRRLVPPRVTETPASANAARGASMPTRAIASMVVSDGTRTVTLTAASTLLGRDDDCDVVVDHPATSRIHARISLAKGQFTLTDETSRNGTTLNGATVLPSQSRVLAAGDRIELGAPEATWTVLEVARSKGTR